ncbi:MAG: ChaN family lipoprotein [Armatimonadota bacterium]|nr:ChaN family lipoprotein [Armatimonadota bacterium]
MIAFIQVDPWLLEIGHPGTVQVAPGIIVDTASGHQSSLEGIVAAAAGKRYVLVGEEHDNPEAHQWQAKIIEALHKSGRRVIVGYEMIQRPEQFALDLWTLGKLSEPEFLEKVKWQTSWGFDFGLYRPIFEMTRKYGLRNVALNVPRDWVRAVGRGGYDALPSEAKSQVPQLDLTNEDHKKVFNGLMGGHPMGSPNVYAAQVLWDEAMSDSAVKYLGKTIVSDKTVFVVVAGNGHVMYGQGIGWRLEKRTGEKALTVVTVSGDTTSKVSRGAGDFVIGVKPAPTADRQ